MDSFSYHIKHSADVTILFFRALHGFLFQEKRAYALLFFVKPYASSHWESSYIHMLALCMWVYCRGFVCAGMCVRTCACVSTLCSCAPHLLFHRKKKLVLSCLREKQNKNSTAQISSPLCSSRWQTVIRGGSCQSSVSEVCSSGDLLASGSPDAPEGVYELWDGARW